MYHTRYKLYVFLHCSMLGDIAAGLGIQKSVFVQKMADPLVDEDARVEWKYTCTRMYQIFVQ